MEEPFWNPELTTIVFAELYGEVSCVGGRSLTRIDHHIQDGAAGHPHQLGLGHRRALEMQAPQNPLLLGPRMIVLNEVDAWGDFIEQIPAINFGKKAACIAVTGWGDETRALDIERLNLHIDLNHPSSKQAVSFGRSAALVPASDPATSPIGGNSTWVTGAMASRVLPPKYRDTSLVWT